MLYTIDRPGRYNDTIFCALFETETESTIVITDLQLLDLMIEHKEAIANLRLVEGKIYDIKEDCWYKPEYNKAHPGIYYRILAILGEDKFKIVDDSGNVSYVNSEELKTIKAENSIANCNLTGDDLEFIDVPKVITDQRFEEDIAKKYERYNNMCMMLGYNSEFGYIVEGEEVKITKYTGTSKTVIIPNFITSINEEAFCDTSITELTLNNGLKSIGSKAFYACNIAQLEIPKSVTFIGKDAFNYNDELFRDSKYTDNMKILNRNALVINEYTTSSPF